MSEPASLHEALLAFQADAPKITKNAVAKLGSFSYEYADLPSLHEEVFPRLTALGLTWVTTPTIHEGQPALGYALTFEADEGDEAITGVAPLLMKGGGPQDMGSAITYMRRYVLCAVLGLAPDKDDDASAAQSPPVKPKKITKARAKAIAERAEAVKVVDKLQLAVLHVSGEDPGELEGPESAAEAVAKLNESQAEKLHAWLSKKEQEALES